MSKGLMFTTVDDFVHSWEDNAKRTANQMNTLTDESLSQEINSEHRNLGRVAWHVVTTIAEMSSLIGLDLTGPAKDAPLPKTAKEIVDGYNTIAESLTEKVKSWKDEDFQTEDDLFGETWKRGLTLKVIVDHEIHHVGQMTVLMRQAELKVPGLYGPSKEEWANYGGQPPEI